MITTCQWHSTPQDVLMGFTCTFSSSKPFEPSIISSLFTDVETEAPKGKSLDLGHSRPITFPLLPELLRRNAVCSLPKPSTHFHLSVPTHTQSTAGPLSPGPEMLGWRLEIVFCSFILTTPVRQPLFSFTNEIKEAERLSDLWKFRGVAQYLARKGRKLEEEINMYSTPRVCLWPYIHGGVGLGRASLLLQLLFTPF